MEVFLPVRLWRALLNLFINRFRSDLKGFSRMAENFTDFEKSNVDFINFGLFSKRSVTRDILVLMVWSESFYWFPLFIDACSLWIIINNWCENSNTDCHQIVKWQNITPHCSWSKRPKLMKSTSDFSKSMKLSVILEKPSESERNRFRNKFRRALQSRIGKKNSKTNPFYKFRC